MFAENFLFGTLLFSRFLFLNVAQFHPFTSTVKSDIEKELGSKRSQPLVPLHYCRLRAVLSQHLLFLIATLGV